MKNENEKKGLFERLVSNKNTIKSCCCNFEVEEIPEENAENKNENEAKKDKRKLLLQIKFQIL